MDNQYGIPSVDLMDFQSSDPETRNKFVKELGNAYETIGFVAVKNHGISEQLQDELYDNIKAFFNLDPETKKKYELEELAGQRGYVSFGKESAKDSNHPDLKEFWHFGQYFKSDDPLKEHYPDNIIVDELPAFNTIGKRIYQQLEETGAVVLRAIALHLNLEEDYFDNKVFKGNSILRPIHYPPIVGEPKGSVRAGQHEDINLITLLMGASSAGLQVLNKKGEWIAVTALPEHIVVNVGDMLQRLTNNRLKSTTHRVVNPPKELWGTSRYSIPFFLHPKSDVSLRCLDNCIDENNPKKYADTTAGEYLMERLKELGLKK